MAEYTVVYPKQRYNKSESIFNQFPTTKKVAVSLTLSLNTDNKKDIASAKENKYVNKTTAAAFMLGGGLLFLSRGVQKNTIKSLEKLRGLFEKKLDEGTLSNQSKKTPFYEYFIRKINSFIQKSESINNITSLKDILFMKSMYKFKATQKIHSGISKLFENLSINTVKKAYKKTQKDFNKMYDSFDNLDDYILKNNGSEIVEYKGKQVTKQELLEQAKEYRESVKMVVDSFMSENAQKARYNYIKTATSKLYSNFWEESFKGFWSKDNKFRRRQMWQTFIASEQVKGNKTDLTENVAFARNMLSYTDAEKMNYISGYVKNLSSIISADDAKGIDIMKRIEWFACEPSALKSGKKEFLKEIDKLDEYSIKTSPNKNIAKIQLSDKNTNIRLIRNIVDDNGTGELQDMLDIYHVIAPFELAKSGALKSAEKAVKSFDKSVELEVGEFFDKARDLELGSAPTDILTILLSCGMITYGLGRAKEKDERTSVLLKSGIPIVGAVATSLISATKLVSGGKSLALGFASGIALNQMGKVADKYRKKYFSNSVVAQKK